METSVSSVIKQISQALSSDPRTQKAVIDVGYEHGVVILTGVVKSASILQAAEEIARSQPGVISAVNELKVA